MDDGKPHSLTAIILRPLGSAMQVAGGFGIGLFALAMYVGVALGLEDAHQREVLPLFRRGAAAHSFAGFEEQLERLEAEAGIRQQL